MKIFLKRFLSFTMALVCVFSLFASIPFTTVEAASKKIDMNVSVSNDLSFGATAYIAVTYSPSGGDTSKITRYKVVATNGKETVTKTVTNKNVTRCSIPVSYFNSKYTVTVTPMKGYTALAAKDNSKKITTKKFTGNAIIITGEGYERNDYSGKYYIDYKICCQKKQSGVYVVAYKPGSNTKYATAAQLNVKSKASQGYYYYTGRLYVKQSGTYYLWADNANFTIESGSKWVQ